MSLSRADDLIYAAATGMTTQPASSFPRRLARAIIALEWLFLLLLLPLTLNIGASAAVVLAAIPLLWGVRRIAWGQFIPATPLNIPILLLLLLILANTQTTVNEALSLAPTVRLVYAAGVFFAAAAFAARSPRHLVASLGLYLVMGMAIGALSLFATDWQAKLPLLSAIARRLPASLQAINANYLAGVLLWFTPLIVALAAGVLVTFGALRRRVGLLPAGGLALASVVIALAFLALHLLTQSRGGLAGLAAALAFLVLLSILRRPRLLLVAVLLAVLAVFAVQRYTTTAFWLELAGVSPVADLREPATYGLDSRVEIWQRAWYAIEDFPITGMGLGAYEQVVSLLYPYQGGGEATAIPHAHNQLLHTAAELGVPALLTYLALWLVTATLLVAVWRNARQQTVRFITAGLAACLLGFFVYGLAEAVPLGDRPDFIFWYLLALVAALYQLAGATNQAVHHGQLPAA